MSKLEVPATLTVTDIRGILRIGTNSAYNLLHSKAFPVKRIGNSYRIPSAPFYQWLGTRNLDLAEKLASKS